MTMDRAKVLDWAKASVLAACLALPASVGTALAADQATDAKPADTKAVEAKPAETKPAAPAAASKASDEPGKPTLSKGEIRKLDAKCSDEADAKHLHGEPRRMFRNACKSKGGLKPA